MDISEVSKQTGIPSSALRYYEQKGLITSVREKGERRPLRPLHPRPAGLDRPWPGRGAKPR